MPYKNNYQKWRTAGRCGGCGGELEEDRKERPHCLKCHKKNMAIRRRPHVARHNVIVRRLWRDKQREIAIRAYGGQCQKCKEKDLDVLVIDHVNGDGQGNSIRKTMKGYSQGVELYKYLAKLGYPKDDYQCLCCNCNMKKFRMWLRAQVKQKDEKILSKAPIIQKFDPSNKMNQIVDLIEKGCQTGLIRKIVDISEARFYKYIIKLLTPEQLKLLRSNNSNFNKSQLMATNQRRHTEKLARLQEINK